MTSTKALRFIASGIGSAALVATMTGLPSAQAETARAAAPPICDYRPTADTQQQQSPIDERYDSDARLQEALGAPIADEVITDGIRYREYERGHLYWTEATGVHEIRGDILGTYLANGGYEALGVPFTDECEAAYSGRYNHLTGTDSTGMASIYWHSETGSHLLYGPIREHWERADWEQGIYGFPTSDTAQTADGIGLYSDFRGNDGSGGSIYWTPDTGVHGMKGVIRQHWLSLEGPASYLGYPTSDEFATPSGARCNFQGGYITWNAETGEVQDHSW